LSRPVPRRITSPRINQPGGDYRRFVLGVLLVLLVAAAGWQVFDLGRYHGGYDSESADAERERLWTELTERDAALTAARAEVARLERTLQIELTATELARDELLAAQKQRNELERRIRFLRGLVSDESGPFQIRDFLLVKGAEAAQFNYSFTIINSSSKTETTTVDIKLDLMGRKGGEEQRIPVAPVEGGEGLVRIEFKHFHDVKGSIELPEGYMPDAMVVEIRPKSTKLKPISKIFMWSIGEPAAPVNEGEADVRETTS